MKISVVTTVLNDRDGMRSLLESLQGQEGPFEVVVVDAGSTDGTVDAVRDAPSDLDVRLIERPGPRGEGFHTGATAATGEVLAFIGADDRAGDGWLAALRRAFTDSEVSIVVGTNILDGDGPKLERVPWIVKGQDISHAGCNTSYRASVYRDIGGIDPAFVTAEDMELNLRAVRAGHSIREVPDAVVYRTVRPSDKVLKQAYWNGYGRGQLRRKHGKVSGMKRGVLHNLVGSWAALRLIAGYFGYRKGRRSEK